MGSAGKEPWISEVRGVEDISPALLKELREIEAQFDVSAAKLKEISHRFEEELREGLDGYGKNIVSQLVQYSMLCQLTTPAHERHLDTRLPIWP